MVLLTDTSSMQYTVYHRTFNIANIQLFLFISKKNEKSTLQHSAKVPISSFVLLLFFYRSSMHDRRTIEEQ